jgi:hypothetical protein
MNFEVRHPRCVSQITKLYSGRLKVKTQLYIYIYIYIYIADDGNSKQLHVSASNRLSSGCTSNEKG